MPPTVVPERLSALVYYLCSTVELPLLRQPLDIHVGTFGSHMSGPLAELYSVVSTTSTFGYTCRYPRGSHLSGPLAKLLSLRDCWQSQHAYPLSYERKRERKRAEKEKRWLRHILYN
jgi:hypothetical protein